MFEWFLLVLFVTYGSVLCCNLDYDYIWGFSHCPALFLICRIRNSKDFRFTNMFWSETISSRNFSFCSTYQRIVGATIARQIHISTLFFQRYVSTLFRNWSQDPVFLSVDVTLFKSDVTNALDPTVISCLLSGSAYQDRLIFRACFESHDDKINVSCYQRPVTGHVKITSRARLRGPTSSGYVRSLRCRVDVMKQSQLLHLKLWQTTHAESRRTPDQLPISNLLLSNQKCKHRWPSIKTQVRPQHTSFTLQSITPPPPWFRPVEDMHYFLTSLHHILCQKTLLSTFGSSFVPLEKIPS